MNLPRYKCHKEVNAVKIKKIIKLNGSLAAATIIPDCDEPGVNPFGVSQEYMERHQPEVGGYYVEYDDGYISYSPCEPFENGYSRI